MENNKRRKIMPFIAAFALVFLGIISGTLAYYTSNDTFNNEFNTGKYMIEAKETFESPDNWLPGDTTPKVLTVKNTGEVDAIIKVCLNPEWEDGEGNSLSLWDDSGHQVAIINYADEASGRWLPDCNYDDCYYYYRKLKPGETTEKLFESVTFNHLINYGSTPICTENDGEQICNSQVNNYNGAKYTLKVTIETIQYSALQEFSEGVEVYENGMCKNLDIPEEVPDRTGRVAYNFTLNDVAIKESELANYDISKASCEIVYANEVSNENKYYKCQGQGALYLDQEIYQEGDTVTIKEINKRYIGFNNSIEQADGSYLLTDATEYYDPVYYWSYDKTSKFYFTYNNNDDEVMNFSNIKENAWINSPYDNNIIVVYPNSTFTMPNHGVIFKEFIYNS